MISAERFIILCFLTQVSIGFSYAQSTDEDDTTTKPSDFEINSEENKIEDGPFFFKINAKRNKPYTLPILEKQILDDFDRKTAWEVYNNKKTSKVEQNKRNDDQDEKAESAVSMESPNITLNESPSTIISDDVITTPASSSGRLEKILVEPLHQSTYIYFYKPFDSSRTSGTSSTTEKETKNDIGADQSAFSSLGFGYPFLDNIFSVPSSNARIQATPKVYHTPQVQEEDQGYDHGVSSLGFGYPFINNFHSFLDERPIKRAVTKVKIYSTNFEDDQPTEQEEILHADSSFGDGKVEGSTVVGGIKDEKVKESTQEPSNFEDEIKLEKDEKSKEKSANVEDILGSIMPIYEWATSSLLNMNMNQDILNIGNILRSNYYGTLAKHSDTKEEHSKSEHPLPDILPDVDKDYENDTPEPRSFIEEVMDEINGDSDVNRELNIERPPTDKDLPDIGSEDPKIIKPRSPAKCICGFSQGRTNSCTCSPETFVYYQYCSVPLPPTD